MQFAFAAVLSLLVALSLAVPSNARSTPTAETPSESCLTVETLPVPAGEQPHDVAPAADGKRV